MTADKNIVLIHGAMLGGWCWDRVKTILKKHGYRVLTPTLTGHAEKAALLTRETNFETYVDDVLDAIAQFKAASFMLVGHSFAGNIITAVAAQMPECIEQLVYLDAMVPMNGQSALSTQSEAVQELYLKTVKTKGQGWYLPPFDGLLDKWHVTDPALRTMLLQRMSNFPLAANTQAIQFDESALAIIPKHYIYATPPNFPAAMQYAQDQGWQMQQIGTTHLMMLTEPARVGEMLMTVNSK